MEHHRGLARQVGGAVAQCRKQRHRHRDHRAGARGHHARVARPRLRPVLSFRSTDADTLNVAVADQFSGHRGELADVRDMVAVAASKIKWAVSPAGVLAFSGPVREVLGQLPDANLAQEMEAVLAPMLDVLRSGTGWDDCQLKQTLDAPSGPRHLLIHCRLQPDGGGYVGIITNASDHEQVEESLRDLADRYRLLVEISPDMIVVHQDGILRYVNPTGLTWMSAKIAGDMVGRSLTAFVAASSVGPLLERIAELDRPGAVSTPTEMTVVTVDGRHLLLEAQSVRTTWEGRPAFQVFLRDHSERRRAESAVRYQANLVASVSDAVLATDLDSRITGWNPAAADLYRLGGSEAIGRKVVDILGENATTADGEVRAGEVEHLRGDGTVVAVRVSVAPLRDEMGQRCGQVAVCADQSYRLLAAAERRLAEERFTTVVTALSEGIVVVQSDGIIRSMNPAAKALLGERVAEG